MKTDDKGERRYAGMTLEEVGELLRTVTKEYEWVLSKREDLRKEYPNRFIAVKYNRVIANSVNREDVVAELERRNIDPRTAYIEYLPEKRPRYLLHN